MAELAFPDGYAHVLAGIKQRVREGRYRAQRLVNSELIHLNWQVGHVLAEATDRSQWGDEVIDRVAADLHSEFPGVTGFSPRNLKYMRSFARAWPNLADFRQQPVAQVPWGHITVLLDKLADQDARDWHAGQAVTHGWTRAVLEHHVKTTAQLRFGAAPTNFDRVLEPTPPTSPNRSPRTPTSSTSSMWNRDSQSASSKTR